MLASTVNWAFYTVIGHKTIRKLGPERATAAAMCFGWAMLLPLFLLRSGAGQFGRLSASGWLALVFLGVCCSGLGYLFWYGGLERMEASQVASFLHLEPVVTLTAAVVLLGEVVVPATALGGVLVIAGVSIVQHPGRGRLARTGSPAPEEILSQSPE